VQTHGRHSDIIINYVARSVHMAPSSWPSPPSKLAPTLRERPFSAAYQ